MTLSRVDLQVFKAEASGAFDSIVAVAQANREQEVAESQPGYVFPLGVTFDGAASPDVSQAEPVSESSVLTPWIAQMSALAAVGGARKSNPVTEAALPRKVKYNPFEIA